MKLTPTAQAGIGLAIIALAGPAGFLLYRGVLGDYRPSAATYPSGPNPGPVSAAGAPPASAAEGTAPAATALPQRLPDIALPDANGTLHRLSDYRGKPLLLNFWASWCEPCRREIPLLQALERRQDPPVQVVGVAMDIDADALKFARAQGIVYPLLMGEKNGVATATAVGMKDLALPFTVVADGRGDIITVKLGELHPDEADLILAQVAGLDAGRSSVADVRRRISTGLRDLAVARARRTQAPGSGPV